MKRHLEFLFLSLMCFLFAIISIAFIKEGILFIYYFYKCDGIFRVSMIFEGMLFGIMLFGALASSYLFFMIAFNPDKL